MLWKKFANIVTPQNYTALVSALVATPCRRTNVSQVECNLGVCMPWTASHMSCI